MRLIQRFVAWLLHRRSETVEVWELVPYNFKVDWFVVHSRVCPPVRRRAEVLYGAKE